MNEKKQKRGKKKRLMMVRRKNNGKRRRTKKKAKQKTKKKRNKERFFFLPFRSNPDSSSLFPLRNLIKDTPQAALSTYYNIFFSSVWPKTTPPCRLRHLRFFVFFELILNLWNLAMLSPRVTISIRLAQFSSP